MDKDLIVAIFTPTKGAAKGAKGGMRGIFGTGYPVSEDLILTSRHVVEPENRNRRAKIRVRWFYDKPAGGKTSRWITIERENLVWAGEGDLDAALIRCRRPESLSRFRPGRLVERQSRDGERWESSGFARANKREEIREPGEFGGTLRSQAEGKQFFEVLEDAQPVAEDQWSGVSGMPVCVGSEILGVVKHVPRHYDHKKLEAVPTWRLLQDEDFKKHLGLADDTQMRLERARQLLLRLLERSEEVTRDLAAALNPKRGCGHIPDCRNWVVETLLNETPSLERLFDMAIGVQDRRRAKGDRPGVRVTAELMLTILPVIQDAAVLSEVHRCKGDASICTIALRTKLSTLAEIIMAGVDRRAAQLRPPATKLVFPEGVASLPEPPESGRDADGKQFARDWRAHLVETFDTDLAQFSGAFRDYLKERFIPSDFRSPHAGVSEQELLDTVAAQLRQEAEAKQDRLTYYFITRLPSSPKAREARETVLSELKADFPHIAFLRLAGTEALNLEWSRYGKLRDLLYEDPEREV